VECEESDAGELCHSLVELGSFSELFHQTSVADEDDDCPTPIHRAVKCVVGELSGLGVGLNNWRDGRLSVCNSFDSRVECLILPDRRSL
jgi:hypothetical protein